MTHSTQSAPYTQPIARLHRKAASLARRALACGAGLLVVASLAAKPTAAQGYSELHDFTVYSGGAPAYPSVLAQGRDNNLYGVTSLEGTHSKGSIFKITPSGTFTTLYSFDGTHGSTPIGGLTLGLDGNLWGMAERGGVHGYGNIFRITPAGSFTVIYSFTGAADGGLPVSPLIVGSDGNFYGTSYPGAAFKLTPAGVLTVLTKIPTSSYGPLLETRNGTFWGVTEFGGKYGAGIIYKITGNISQIVHHFTRATGCYPIGGLVLGEDGNYYGTTTAGGSRNGGVVYRITPAGVYSVVVNFDSKHTANGYEADAGLIAGSDGKMYGTTIWGGQFGYGVIFSLTTDGDYAVLYSFDRPHGDGAYATPMQHTNGSIFGKTNRGGAGGIAYGVVYSFAAGIDPFLHILTLSGTVGQSIGILGKGFSAASSVEFNGTPASFHVISNTYMTATIPSGESGFVRVNMASGDQMSSSPFYVKPQITGISPASGKAGTEVTVSGNGLIQAESVAVGAKQATLYTVDSDGKVTFKLPAGAKSGKVVLKTPGGTATSTATFTVTP